ncbi:unnamed protein product [Mytilus coruscus]|uniref:SAP domain-containing protein n=1 Tax=Mytilus coruscus TaxID=42192 RepID=A0A6J8A8S8_MYTCO|nr:unnamed protein product [Mytilus coruscus]
MSENDTSIDTFKRWTVPVLQQYLRIRGLRTSGKKEELVALVYSANLMKIKQVLTPAEERKLKADQYCDKLKAPKGIVPDPLIDLTSGWITESKGVSMWPPTMYYYIATFLQKKEDRSLSYRLMKDYKEGKAYSYFTFGWLREVCYHHIDNNSPYCFLKAECTASQRINDVPHTTWVLLEKVSGEIQTAYWKLSDALLPACQNAAVFQYIHHNYTHYEPSEDFNVLSTETVTTTEGTILPLSLPETAGNCHDHNELLEKLKYTDADREKILQETRGQSENTEWFNQRKGRITCSRMHSVFTKSETLKKNNAVNTESLILGYKEKNSNIPALKYGRIMEPVARRKYKCILLQRKHQDLKVKETGLYIDTKKGYLGSSPDGMVECSCCGSGMLEVKCPLSIAHTIPSHVNT